MAGTIPAIQETGYYVDLLLPLPIPTLLTYQLPAALHKTVVPGVRALVPLGTSKLVTGIVVSLHSQPPAYATRAVVAVLDDTPRVLPIQLQFFQWLAQYYVCTAGEVLNKALPAGLKLSSQSMLQLHPALDSTLDFSTQEQQLLDAIQQHTILPYAAVAKIVQPKQVHALIKSLLQKQAILLVETIQKPYRPKQVKHVHLATAHTAPAALQTLCSQLEKYPKQLAVLLRYLSYVTQTGLPPVLTKPLPKQTLLQAGISASALQRLITNQVFREESVVVSRFTPASAVEPAPVLTPAQQEALQAIHRQWATKAVVLLHGVTGSGKTALYIQLIEQVLEQGGQVLYLVPEIALTTQLVRRLQQVFGEQVGIYHSRYARNERVEVWQQVLVGKCPVVLGVRSAIFLPFRQLHLLIVDEEHEAAYKQWEGTPRYHARDSGIVLAQYHQAKVLLGSATPAIETYYKACSGKYGLVTLTERFGQAVLPDIVLTNVRVAQQRKQIRAHCTTVLIEALQAVLDQQGQAIMFQNRRGYAPYIICQACSEVPMCTRCAVHLTYHQARQALCCHYCGYQVKMPHACPVCRSPRLQTVGFGTEKLAESLQNLFPQHKIQRMDVDTTRGKYQYEKIITAFEQGQTDILVGTQLVTKGLDFDRVHLVGVFDIDRLLYFPDFRAHERCFQLLTQVSGRSGRGKTPGKVIIQTAQPHHSVFAHVVAHDYVGMYQQELPDRQQFLYPPYVRLIKLTMQHTDPARVAAAAAALSATLRQQLSDDILGPQAPVIAKLRTYYLQDIWIKIHPGTVDQLTVCKKRIQTALAALYRKERLIRVLVDVDPL